MKSWMISTRGGVDICWVLVAASEVEVEVSLVGDVQCCNLVSKRGLLAVLPIATCGPWRGQ